MKKKEELNEIIEKVNTANKKSVELNDEELTQVLGGVIMQYDKNENETTNFKPLKQRSGKPLDIVEID